MYVRGIIAFLISIFLMVSLAVEFDGPLYALFFDGASALAFVFAVTAVILSQGGFKTFFAAVNALISKKYHISAAEKEKAVRLFRLIGKTVTGVAFITAVIGTINMLGNLDDPSYLGSNVATVLLTLFYGLTINTVLINPAVNVLETRYNTEERPVISEKQVIDKLLELCYKQGISPEEIMDATELKVSKN
jgi:flagellar motor component MotA